MSSPSRPSKAVYRRRRLVALLLLVTVVALLVWGVTSLVGALSGGQPAAETATPTASAPAETAAAPVETPAPEPTPEPPAGPVDCAAPALVVTAALDATNYAPEAQPQLSMTIANTGAVPCILNVGTAAQVYTISSGADTIWVSSHCQTEPADDIVTIEAGQTVSAPPISWVRERSAPDTCGTERPAAVAGGAYYQLSTSVSGIASEPLSFVLD